MDQNQTEAGHHYVALGVEDEMAKQHHAVPVYAAAEAHAWEFVVGGLFAKGKVVTYNHGLGRAFRGMGTA
jgi:hypothetical protein